MEARAGDLSAVSIQMVFEVWDQVRLIICEESVAGEEKRAEDRILEHVRVCSEKHRGKRRNCYQRSVEVTVFQEERNGWPGRMLLRG